MITYDQDQPGPSCGICKGMLERLSFSLKGRRRSYPLYRCRTCQAEQLVPQPNKEDLAFEYDGYFERRGNWQKNQKVKYFEGLLSRLPLPREPLRVLVLGEAEGDMLWAIHQRHPHWSLSAVEMNWKERMPELPDGDYWPLMVSDWMMEIGPKHLEPFDVIFAMDFLEHMDDPMEFLGALVSGFLHKRGFVVATFPNCTALSRKLLGRLWPQYKVEHLFYFSEGSIPFLAAKAGLRTLQLLPLQKELPLAYLTNVGSNFGPAPVRWVSEAARRFFPRALAQRTMALGLGEWLWVAQSHPTKQRDDRNLPESGAMEICKKGIGNLGYPQRHTQFIPGCRIQDGRGIDQHQ